MANECFNWASLEGSKEMLDLLETRLAKATEELNHLWWETYFNVLGMPIQEGVSYEVFGSRWFDPYWERQSDTTATLSGSSAWSPVSEFFRKLSETYALKIESTFEECGCDFGGWFDCINGQVIKDVTTTYQAYRFQEGDTEYFNTLLEDIDEGYYDSIDDMDSTFMSLLSEAQTQELITAINNFKSR